MCPAKLVMQHCVLLGWEFRQPPRTTTTTTTTTRTIPAAAVVRLAQLPLPPEPSAPVTGYQAQRALAWASIHSGLSSAHNAAWKPRPSKSLSDAGRCPCLVAMLALTRGKEVEEKEEKRGEETLCRPLIRPWCSARHAPPLI